MSKYEPGACDDMAFNAVIKMADFFNTIFGMAFFKSGYKPGSASDLAAKYTVGNLVPDMMTFVSFMGIPQAIFVHEGHLTVLEVAEVHRNELENEAGFWTSTIFRYVDRDLDEQFHEVLLKRFPKYFEGCKWDGSAHRACDRFKNILAAAKLSVLANIAKEDDRDDGTAAFLAGYFVPGFDLAKYFADIPRCRDMYLRFPGEDLSSSCS